MAITQLVKCFLISKSMSIVHKLKGHEDRVRFVAWSPFGDKFVSASDDRTLIIWDASTGEKILELKGHANWVLVCAWSPKGDFIVSCGFGAGSARLMGNNPGEIFVWNATTGENIFQLKGHSAAVMGVACHPKGDFIVSCSYDENCIVWNAATGEKISELKGHSGAVRAVSCSPKGDIVISASDDKTLNVWDAVTGAKVSALEGHAASVDGVASSPDGAMIATCSADKDVLVWDVGGARSGEQVITPKCAVFCAE